MAPKRGNKAPASGEYGVVGPGGYMGGEVTVVKGEPMPPTPKPCQWYVMNGPPGINQVSPKTEYDRLSCLNGSSFLYTIKRC